MRKILLLLLGGVLLMVTVTGCSNKKSKEEIESSFTDFMSVFQSDNYEFLYDKEGDSSNLPEGDLGSWILASYIDQSDGNQYNSKGIQLVFNKNLRKCRGYFILDNNKYPIFYDNGKMELIDQETNLDVKDELSNFKLLFDVISLDESYLHTLKPQNHFYNDEVPLYGTSYYLPVDDDNRAALEDAYPSFAHHDKEAILEFEGTGSIPWNTTNSTVLRVMFDIEGHNYFSARMKFSSTDKFNELFVE